MEGSGESVPAEQPKFSVRDASWFNRPNQDERARRATHAYAENGWGAACSPEHRPLAGDGWRAQDVTPDMICKHPACLKQWRTALVQFGRTERQEPTPKP